MLLHRTQLDDGLDSHRTAIAALGHAVSRARHLELLPVEGGGGPGAARAVRLTDAPKSPSRRRNRGRGDLRAVAPSEVPVVTLAELASRRGRPAPGRSAS